MYKRRIPAACRWLCALIVTVLAIASGVVWLREPRLLDRATRIMLMQNRQWYDWYSENELLVSHRGNYWIKGLDKVKIPSGDISPILPLASQFAASEVVDVVGLSPNKKWIVCHGFQGKSPSYEFFSLDGRKRSYEEEGMKGCWTKNSGSWLSSHPQLLIKQMTVEGTPRINEIDIKVDGEPNILGTLPNGHILLVEGAVGELSATVDLLECDLQQRTILRKISIPLPSQAYSDYIVLSPSGKQIVVELRMPKSQSWLSRLLDRLHIRSSSPSMSIWMGELDGQGLRPMGSLDPAKSDTQEDYVSDIRWLPDGKHVSFVYRGILWVIPLTTP
jgi:hypothetical protein